MLEKLTFPRNCQVSEAHHAVPEFNRTESLADSAWDGSGRRKRDTTILAEAWDLLTKK